MTSRKRIASKTPFVTGGGGGGPAPGGTVTWGPDYGEPGEMSVGIPAPALPALALTADKTVGVAPRLAALTVGPYQEVVGVAAAAPALAVKGGAGAGAAAKLSKLVVGPYQANVGAAVSALTFVLDYVAIPLATYVPFTIPNGVTAVKVEGWASGGGGGVASATHGGGGGGGGGFSQLNALAVTPGQTIEMNVGNFGVAASTTSAGPTYLRLPPSTYPLVASGGGYGGQGAANAQGPPGATNLSSAVGDVTYLGGAGGGGGGLGTTNGGGGGGAAGTTGAGNVGASNGTPGAAKASLGGGGGKGGSGLTAADPGLERGGGGGGASTLAAAANGARGGIRVTMAVTL